MKEIFEGLSIGGVVSRTCYLSLFEEVETELEGKMDQSDMPGLAQAVIAAANAAAQAAQAAAPSGGGNGGSAGGSGGDQGTWQISPKTGYLQSCRPRTGGVAVAS